MISEVFGRLNFYNINFNIYVKNKKIALPEKSVNSFYL